MTKLDEKLEQMSSDVELVSRIINTLREAIHQRNEWFKSFNSVTDKSHIESATEQIKQHDLELLLTIEGQNTWRANERDRGLGSIIST